LGTLIEKLLSPDVNLRGCEETSHPTGTRWRGRMAPSKWHRATTER
jgi:hypothetical protein